MIVIVLGMHRSGTSTVAGVLHLNKITMGTYQSFWPRPLAQNPKGFYENFDFRKINDLIMKNVGYDIKSYKPNIPIPKINKRIKNNMVKMISNYDSDFKFWGWKDPRTCLTISNWVDVFEEMGLSEEIKIIFVTRKSVSVARSLKKRNKISLSQGLNLWKTYTENALKFCEKKNISVFYMSFEQILDSPEKHFGTMFKFLNYPFDPSIVNDFVDKNISTSGYGEEINLPVDIMDLEEKIEHLLSI